MDDIELIRASFHPSALVPGDGRPLVTLEHALSALAGLLAENQRLRAVVENIRAYTAPLPGDEISRIWAVANEILEHGEVSVLDVGGEATDG